MVREIPKLFPLELPSSAELEEAAQDLEVKAVAATKRVADLEAAGLFFLAAATYRQVYEERQTREALRALLNTVVSKGVKAPSETSLFEAIFGRNRQG